MEENLKSKNRGEDNPEHKKSEFVNKEYLDNLSGIRSLMERSSSFISLSGLSGISAGIIGMITGLILHYKFSSYLLYEKNYIITNSDISSISSAVILLVVSLLLTFTLTILFTSRKAKKKGLPVWDYTAKKLLINVFIPLVAGGLFCIIAVLNGYYQIVFPSMLIFFGIALVSAAKFTLHEIYWLGISEIVIGLFAFVFIQHSILFWTTGFGLMNIIYGTVMYYRHER